MRLFDSHAHIQDAQFDHDRDDVIARSRSADLAGMLVLGVDLATSRQAVALASANRGFVFAAAGCHPHDAEGMDDSAFAALTELARSTDVVAIGEIGLDFYRDLSPRDKQLDVFGRQLDLAREIDKPVAIHCRDAQEEMLPIIDAWTRTSDAGRPIGVMHYFSGDAGLGAHYAELGFMISIHTSITHPKSTQLQDVARVLPLDTLVVETDSPYGAPQSIRGKRNEPSHVLAAIEAIAGIRGESVDRVAEVTTANALRLLGIESRLTQPAGTGIRS